MITLSRTQVEALADLRYRSSYAKVVMHYNTRRSLRKLGMIASAEKSLGMVLTAMGRQVIDTIGQLTEGTAPLGKDALDNQITVLTVGSTTIDLAGSY